MARGYVNYLSLKTKFYCTSLLNIILRCVCIYIYNIIFNFMKRLPSDQRRSFRRTSVDHIGICLSLHRFIVIDLRQRRHALYIFSWKLCMSLLWFFDIFPKNSFIFGRVLRLKILVPFIIFQPGIFLR